MTPAEALAQWGLETPQLHPWGSGHIHDTWRVESARGRFLLQRINQLVFPDWQRLINNTLQLHEHIGPQARGFLPDLLLTDDGAAVAMGADGSVWRLATWIPHRICLDRLDSARQARAIGGAFGRFQRLAAGLEANIEPAIEGFLDLGERLEQFDAALADGSRKRRSELTVQLEAIARLRDDVLRRVPGNPAVVHGDCKVNNVLLGADGAVVAVVDLDTICVAPRALDFGDLARSATALMAEDEGRPERVAFSEPWFMALAGGFVAEIGADRVTAEELVDGAITMGFMLGTRFAADYLLGDRYFRPQRPDQNRDRTTAQIGLASAFRSARQRLIDGLEDNLREASPGSGISPG